MAGADHKTTELRPVDGGHTPGQCRGLDHGDNSAGGFESAARHGDEPIERPPKSSAVMSASAACGRLGPSSRTTTWAGSRMSGGLSETSQTDFDLVTFGRVAASCITVAKSDERTRGRLVHARGAVGDAGSRRPRSTNARTNDASSSSSLSRTRRAFSRLRQRRVGMCWAPTRARTADRTGRLRARARPTAAQAGSRWR